MSDYDLAIAYRIYPRVARPAQGLPFSEDKFVLSEICLRSFKESLGNLRVKLWVLLDGCPAKYGELFRKYFDAQDLVLLHLQGEGNLATFGRQIEILVSQTDSEFVYFGEDDYFYLPNQLPKMLDFLSSCEEVDFISPYDHPDCYTLEIHRHPKRLRLYGDHHWRTAASTCLTFLTRKNTLRRKQWIFRSYCMRNHDHSLWLSLTKHSLFNPLQFLQFALRSSLFAKIIAKAWLYGWPQILFGKRMKLWVPVPGIATHLNKGGLSPTVNWKALIQEQGEALGYSSSEDATSHETRANAATAR